MRLIRKILAATAVAAFPLAFASGCSSPSGSNSVPAAPSAAIPSLAQQSLTTMAVTPAASSTAQWPQFGYGASHDAYNPLETVIGTANVSSLAVAWNDSSIIQPGGIVVDKNVAYIDDMGQANGGLYALDANTGAQKWYANVNLNGSWGGFTHAVSAVAGDVVVTPCSNGGSGSSFLNGLCGVSTSTGKILWSKYCTEYQGNQCGGLSNNGTSPTLYNGLIYFQSVQGVNEQPDTQALSPKTGAVVWDVGGVYHCPDAGQSNANPLPAFDGLVYAVIGCGSSQGATEVCALSAASGAAAWCDTTTPYVDDLVVGDGDLYLAEPGTSNNVVVIALNAKTGAQRWTQSLPGSNSVTMAVAKAKLIIEDGAAGVFARAAGTGGALWSYTSNANLYGGNVLSVANGVVYTDGGGGNNGNVAIAAFNEANGSLLWSSSTVGNGAAPATPVILNGKVYAGCYTMCAFAIPPASAGVQGVKRTI